MLHRATFDRAHPRNPMITTAADRLKSAQNCALLPARESHVRALLADVYAGLLEPKAKANQKDHGGTAPGRKNTSPKIGESVDSTKEAARKAGVGHGSLDAWRKLRTPPLTVSPSMLPLTKLANTPAAL